MAVKPQEAINTETIIRLAQHHIRRYDAMLERGGPGIRRGECKDLIRVWKTTQVCLRDKLELPAECEHELYDALTCGDYDSWLTPEELSNVEALS